MENRTMKVSDLSELKGQLIEWMSPSDCSNNDYGGIGVITEIVDAKKPIKYKSVIGDDLNFALKHTTNLQGTPLTDGLYYSDVDRDIRFRVIQCTSSMYTDLKIKEIAIERYYQDKIDLLEVATKEEVSHHKNSSINRIIWEQLK